MQIQPKKIELCKTLELFSDNITHVHDKNDWMMVQTAKQHRALEKFTLPCIFVIYVCTSTRTSLDVDGNLHSISVFEIKYNLAALFV